MTSAFMGALSTTPGAGSATPSRRAGGGRSAPNQATSLGRGPQPTAATTAMTSAPARPPRPTLADDGPNSACPARPPMKALITPKSMDSASPASPPRPRISDQIATPTVRPIGMQTKGNMACSRGRQGSDDAPAMNRQPVDSQQQHGPQDRGQDARTLIRAVPTSG